MASLSMASVACASLSVACARTKLPSHHKADTLATTCSFPSSGFSLPAPNEKRSSDRNVSVGAGFKLDFLKLPQIQLPQLPQFQVPKIDSKKEREEIKQELLELIAPLDCGRKATEEDEEAVEEVALRLEALNPTKAPVKSPLINGKWELKYTTAAGVLNKKFPPPLRKGGPIYQCIDTESLQAQNIESWPFFNQVQATLTPLSDTRVDVKFDQFKIASLIPVKSPESARGYLDITYLDEEMRIARGNRGNLFVLTMADPEYRID
eukprot:TRINITY_DN26912_c0_g1_i1.p1 TRINITY_DN26912_c0_g1~~TRINITY_DN26912_c0_g1_i1.p1  ORF type:complete len:265 (-),score=47.03 TRINITY_DN26912_c0_g1_i1:711-1505(-)